MKHLNFFFIGAILQLACVNAFGQTLTTPPVDWSSNGWGYIGKNGGIAGLDNNGNVTSPLLNNVRTGGSDNGTDISNAIVDTSLHTTKSYLYSTQSRPRYIFFGGADNFQLAAQLSPALIQSGKVGLYEHANGVAPLSDADRAAIQATFAPTGSNLVNGGGDAMGEIALTTEAVYVGYFKGKYPVEVNANITGAGTFTESDGTVLGNYLTADQLATFKSGVDAVIPLGVKNVGPVITPNSFDENSIGTDFSTDPYWENARAAALYGGAITIDSPPSYALWQGDKYIKTVISEIKWGLANNLRVTVILSPFNIQNTNVSTPDPELWNNTARFLDELIRADAVPTSYVVETYCGCTTVNPLVGSSDLSGSMDHLVSMLLTAPVSPPGTAVPQSKVPGGASEANAFAPISIGHTIGSTNTSPTYKNVIADINNPAYGANIIGSLGFQSADNVLIESGKIGAIQYGASTLDVFLSPASSFLTQTPLTFQGGSPHGNSDLEGGSSDQWLHLNNRFTTDFNQIGLAFGTDANAPLISRNGGGIYTKDILIGHALTFQGGSNGNSVLSGGANAWLHLSNPYTTDMAQVGLSFDDITGTSKIALALDAGGTLTFSNNINVGYGGSFTDPDSGTTRDAKFGNKGIAVSGGIKTDTITVTGSLSTTSIVPVAVTYATLPTSAAVGQSVFCSDCYSKLREDSDTGTGINVTWNGTRWNDSMGIEAQH